MWLKKGGHLIDLNEIFRVREIKGDDEDPEIGVIMEFKITSSNSDKWSKFWFDSKEERTDFISGIAEMLGAKEIEVDVIGKLE